jgi:TolA-binding protein
MSNPINTPRRKKKRIPFSPGLSSSPLPSRVKAGLQSQSTAMKTHVKKASKKLRRLLKSAQDKLRQAKEKIRKLEEELSSALAEIRSQVKGVLTEVHTNARESQLEHEMDLDAKPRRVGRLIDELGKLLAINQNKQKKAQTICETVGAPVMQ